ARSTDGDRPKLIGRVDYLGRRPVPVYPRASERRREQGRVVVRVVISTQGSVLEAKVQNSSGYERLDESALRAVRTARFKPYTENGVAYRAMADIPFDFVY
ncbi:energy transducer TonB, partial [Alcaligenes pakistanensis]